MSSSCASPRVKIASLSVKVTYPNGSNSDFFDLRRIASKANAYPKVKISSAITKNSVVLKIKSITRATVLVFKSGKMMVLGAKSMNKVHQAVDIVEGFFKFAGYKRIDFKTKSFEITSSFMTHKVKNTQGYCLASMYEMIERHYKNVAPSYTPEVFRGLIWRRFDLGPTKMNGLMNIFPNGHICITDAKSVSAAQELTADFLQFAETFKDEIRSSKAVVSN